MSRCQVATSDVDALSLFDPAKGHPAAVGFAFLERQEEPDIPEQEQEQEQAKSAVSVKTAVATGKSRFKDPRSRSRVR